MINPECNCDRSVGENCDACYAPAFDRDSKAYRDDLEREVEWHRARSRVRIAGLRGLLREIEGKRLASFEVLGRLLNHAIVTNDDVREAHRLGRLANKEKP